MQTEMNGIMDSLMNSTLPTAAILGISGALNPAGANALNGGLDPASKARLLAMKGGVGAGSIQNAIANAQDPSTAAMLWQQAAMGSAAIMELANVAGHSALMGEAGVPGGNTPMDADGAAAMLGQFSAAELGLDANAAALMFQQYKAMAGGACSGFGAFPPASAGGGTARSSPYGDNGAKNKGMLGT